ncbi:hypothetical protein JCM21900_006416 [Sporobolomyces salmonicolor]
MSFWDKVRHVIWGAPPETKAERKLLVKVDFFVLSFLSLMYFSNYLDRANLANAYVSGLKEAASMTGDDLNKVNSLFTAGHWHAAAKPAAPVHPRPYPLPPQHSLTTVTAAAKNTSHLCVIRFFQGFAEASTFVGAHVIMGAWYKEEELCKRAAIFSASAQIATLFSGVLQAAIYRNLDGLHGLAGWGWLFIICGLITVPIGIYGYLFFPDTPEQNRSMVFTQAERELAVARLPPRPETKLDRTVFKRVLGRWRWWVMSLIWIVGGELESVGSNSLHSLWMKNQVATGHEKWTVSDFNYYPQGAAAIAIVTLLATAIWTDYNKKRYQVNLLIVVCMLISSIILLVYDGVSTSGLFFAFYIAGVSYSGQASNFSWANDLTRGDEQERSIVLASMNMWSNVFNSWWSIVFFPADDAPRWKRGMISIIVLCPIMVCLTLCARYLQLRDQRLVEPASDVFEDEDDKGTPRPEAGGVERVNSGKGSVEEGEGAVKEAV